MGFDCLHEVVRAGRVKAATGGRSSAEMQHGAKDALVEANQRPNHGFEQGGHDQEVLKSCSRVACLTQSASSSSKLAEAAPGRAMVTRKRRKSLKFSA